MRSLKSISQTIFTIFLFVSVSSGQWTKQDVRTNAGLRGLSVVSEKIVWASGTGGTVLRTIDGGNNWKVLVVPGAEKVDFRDVEAFDADTAYVMSIGNGAASRIYKTTDGGATWKLQFRNENPKVFFDAIACWDRNSGIVMADPIDGHYPLFSTNNGGDTWKPIVSNNMPAAKDGEAAFAASGTCLITQGQNNAFLVTGGSDARVFRSSDRGRSWSVAPAPITKGVSSAGVFSIAMRDSQYGIIVGGDYAKPNAVGNNIAVTRDGGVTWKLAGSSEYRSGVAFVDRNMVIAVGTSGTSLSRDGGRTWTAAGSENLNAVAAHGRKAIWAVGANGLIVRWRQK